MRTPYTLEEKQYIVNARLAGKTWREIAAYLNRKAEVVRFVITTYWFKEMMEEMEHNT